MDTNINYTVVGAFVIVLFAALVMSVIWLSSGFSLEQYSTYAVYMDESISGLNENATVEYNGVAVGTVDSIDLNSKNPRLVTLLLRIKENTPITRGTVASLASRGLTGLVYIALKDNGTDLRPLVQGPGEPYPIIPTVPSLFTRLDIALTEVSENLKQVSRSIEAILTPENRESLRLTLSHLERITRTLAENNRKLDSILENTARATRQLTPLLKSGENTFNLLESQTIPAVNRSLDRLDNVIRSLSSTADALKENPSVLIRGTQPQPLGPGEGR